MTTHRHTVGDVIFREGDFDLTMYDIQAGSVGIFLDYGSLKQKKLTVLKAHQLFGEMGLIEACPRSATAVALEDGTVLREISEEEFYDFFRKEPERLLQILRQLSARIRENTEKYHEACLALSEMLEAEKTGQGKGKELEQQLKEIGNSAAKSWRPGLHSSFYSYVQQDLAAYEGKRQLVRVSLVERLAVRYISPEEMHANPDDEFSDPDIGPSDRIINEYAHEIPRLYRNGERIFPSPIMVCKMASDGYLIINGHHRWAAAIKSGTKKIRAAIMNPPK